MLTDTSAQKLAETAQMVAGERGRGAWVSVDPAARRLFDIVIMRVGRHPAHCGVMLTRRHVLHIEERTDSIIVPVDHFSVKYRIIETVRHQALQ